jgi:hypothetical protein
MPSWSATVGFAFILQILHILLVEEAGRDGYGAGRIDSQNPGSLPLRLQMNWAMVSWKACTEEP